MALGNWPGDLRVDGHLTCEEFTPPASSVLAASIASGANIEPAKLMRRVSIAYQQPLGAAVADATVLAYIAKKAGQIVRVAVTSTTPPTTTDTVTVDVQRSTAGGAFATVLSAVLTLGNASTARVVTSPTINASLDDYIADDVFEIVINATGTSCQGLLVVLEFEENGT